MSLVAMDKKPYLNHSANRLNHRWEKDHRYYEAQIMEDLYGWVFVRTWGKKGTRLGRSMVEFCEDGMKAIEQVKSDVRAKVMSWYDKS